jgi:hypothetical protein
MQCTTEDEQIHSLYQKLQAVPDYRCKRGRRYEAAKFIVIVLLAKMAGKESVSGIAQWASLRAEWLKAELGLKRMPCANTYAYISRHLDVGALNEQLRSYFAERHTAQSQQGPVEAEKGQAEWIHWALDGKVLRGSASHTPPGQSGQELLYLYAVEAGYLEHCQMIEGKGYEAATAQVVIAEHDCVGKVITADALHTRPRFCRQIRRQQGEYVLVTNGAS